MKNEFLPDGLWVVMDGSEKLVMKKKGFVLSSKGRGGHIDGYTFLRPAINWSDTDMGDTMNVCKEDGFYDVFEGEKFIHTMHYDEGEKVINDRTIVKRTEIPTLPKPELPDGLYLIEGGQSHSVGLLVKKVGKKIYRYGNLDGWQMISNEVFTHRIPLEKL